MKLAGWGRYPCTDATVLEPVTAADTGALLRHAEFPALIARGCGRSYGDSALAPAVVSSRYLDNFQALDTRNNRLRCGAGLRLDEILKILLPHKRFLPVLPGTRFVTVGGAIAADIHGKNHHRDGSFCDHVQSFTLRLASGEEVDCSREQNPELFAATCGGMGLTGVIVAAELDLLTVAGAYIRNDILLAENLDAALRLLEEHQEQRYAVAWIDCLARGDKLGRACVFLGDHDEDNTDTREAHELPLSVPFSVPGFLLNSTTMSAFNKVYYRRQRRRPQNQSVHYQRYFFPLDNVRHWNRLYGRQGFLQYQLLLPTTSARDGLLQILQTVSAAGKGSFLAVLKQMGPGNDNLLSFPDAGFTLTLDFKRDRQLMPLLEKLDAIVLEHGGRLYLAKDARMSETMFRAGYPHWEKFLAVKQQVDPENRFASLQSQRLGLTPMSGA